MSIESRLAKMENYQGYQEGSTADEERAQKSRDAIDRYLQAIEEAEKNPGPPATDEELQAIYEEACRRRQEELDSRERKP